MAVQIRESVRSRSLGGKTLVDSSRIQGLVIDRELSPSRAPMKTAVVVRTGGPAVSSTGRMPQAESWTGTWRGSVAAPGTGQVSLATLAHPGDRLKPQLTFPPREMSQIPCGFQNGCRQASCGVSSLARATTTLEYTGSFPPIPEWFQNVFRSRTLGVNSHPGG